MTSLDEILKTAQSLNEDQQFALVVDLLTDNLLEKYNSADLYAENARAYYRLKKNDLSDKAAEKALSINPHHAKANHYKGNICLSLEYHEEAIDYYNKAIAANPLFTYSYHGLGIIYNRYKQYDKAIKYYTIAIEIDAKDEYPYHGLGNAYASLKEYRKAIEYYSKAIKLSPQFHLAYYNKAIAFYDIGEYKKSLADYELYISLTKESPVDYLISIAKSRIDELKKLIKSSHYREISLLVNKIKAELQFNDGCVTHYTSLTVAKALILNNSMLRLSEGAFLNDTSEGRELFNFLAFETVTSRKGDETEAKPFVHKPFIGSFVAETKHDDLTLWRMYGKENKEEAKGCALTINVNQLSESIKSTLLSDSKKTALIKAEEEFSFYRVAYRKHDGKNLFVVPGATQKQETILNKSMGELYERIAKFKSAKEKESIEVQDIEQLLNRISYLFKSVEYQHENEVRLVVKGVGFEKEIDEQQTIPRVYIELVNISPIIKKITLGPKVDRADEWAAAFYYSLDKKDFHPEIFISHLPFK